jgi:decaprenylphospho-beta-D-ribofuranose 2-oxidase
MRTGGTDMRGFALADVDLSSFDRQFRAQSRVQRPDRYRLIEALPRDAQRIARGSGVSYVAASFGADAISQSLEAFDRVLAFDDANGRLEVEAGARIGDVQRFALARGWYLPVAPGHPAATIGGCIAADVHGKNPARDGTFRSLVERIEISTARGETIVADPATHSDLFAATFAGFGLTGTITRATLRLARPPAALVMRRMPVANLVDAARVLREAANAPVLYGWHDGRPGRGSDTHSVRGERSAATRRADAVHAVEPRRHRSGQQLARCALVSRRPVAAAAGIGVVSFERCAHVFRRIRQGRPRRSAVARAACAFR